MMKKIMLGLFVSCLAFNTYAQSLKLEINGENVNGKHIKVYGVLDDNHFTVKSYFTLTNLTNAKILVSGDKTDIIIPENAYATWCGWDNCFVDDFANKDLDPEAIADNFYAEYSPNPDQDSAVVHYKLFISGNEDDFVETTITFIVGEKPVSIEQSAKALASVKAYPNPATNNAQFTFNLPSTQQAKLVFRNISGNTVKIEDITGLNSKNVNISNLTSGLYFYSIEQNGGTIAVGKLIVK